MTLDWKKHLRRLFRQDEPVAVSPEAARGFVRETAPEAFRTLTEELAPHVHDVRVASDEDQAEIVLQADAASDPFRYRVSFRMVRVPNFAFPEINTSGDEPRRYRAEVHVNGDRERKNVVGWSEDVLIRDVLLMYEEHVTWRD